MSDEQTSETRVKSAIGIIKEIWKGVEWFSKKLRQKYPSPARRILIIGPGGTGKTTLAKVFSGDLMPWVFGGDWKYAESREGEDDFKVLGEDDVEIVVPTGQDFDRDQQWANVIRDISKSRYSGIVLAVANGHHSWSTAGYEKHKLYDGDLIKFREALINANHVKELNVLKYLMPALQAVQKKLWLLTVVMKEDLWFKQQNEVCVHYTDSNRKWGRQLKALSTKLGSVLFRHQSVHVSLVSLNLKDPEGKVVFETAAGYDSECQMQSVKRLCDAFDDLRKWEAEI